MADVTTYQGAASLSPAAFGGDSLANSFTQSHPNAGEAFDYSFVRTPAQIAVYDDFLSEPRILVVQPAPTTDFIGTLAATIYQQAQAAGGTIAYSIILQVTENFIHARFSEMVVSIYNHGKTIRFSDQGPGFRNKEMALQPGFSSATQPMKRYIKGVGSGLPTVKEWLRVANEGGRIAIEDNLNGGAVVTLTVGEESEIQLARKKQSAFLLPPLTDIQKACLLILHQEGPLRNVEIEKLTNNSKSTVSTSLAKLKELRLVDNEPGTKRRMLTELGEQAANTLKSQ